MSVGTAGLRENLTRVQAQISDTAARAGRGPDSVKLIAVSKTMPPERVAEAVAAGLRCFGENRVQEAANKIPAVQALIGQPLEWHLIGTLQRNKARAAIELFAILQSVDSLRLAETISRLAAARRVPVLLEVYLGDDPSRPGFRPAELTEQLDALAALPGLSLSGLMTVAPLGIDERATRQVFSATRELRDQLVVRRPDLALPELSMGMTDDFPLAIAEGATMVRVGRAIFGARPSQSTI